jgi:hypothetical protein
MFMKSETVNRLASSTSRFIAVPASVKIITSTSGRKKRKGVT